MHHLVEKLHAQCLRRFVDHTECIICGHHASIGRSQHDYDCSIGLLYREGGGSTSFTQQPLRTPSHPDLSPQQASERMGEATVPMRFAREVTIYLPDQCGAPVIPTVRYPKGEHRVPLSMQAALLKAGASRIEEPEPDVFSVPHSSLSEAP